MSLSLRITDTPGAEVEAIGKALTAFNESDVGPSERRPLAVIAEDEGVLVAGLSGSTSWGWLYVQWLWVDAARRGEGLAGKMLDRAEAEARARGCKGANIDCFNPVARRTYERQGYAVFGEIPDYVAGRSRWFLSKRWG